MANAGILAARFYIGFRDTPDATKPKDTGSVPAAGGKHFASPKLCASFIIVLFAFVGTFTYVNFGLVSERFAVPTQYRGLVYFVFISAIFIIWGIVGLRLVAFLIVEGGVHLDGHRHAGKD